MKKVIMKAGGIYDCGKLAIYYENKHSCRSASYLRFILMVFVCFWNFGSPEPTGVLNALSGFAIPAFYILSGFFILNENKEVRQKKQSVRSKNHCYGSDLLL